MLFLEIPPHRKLLTTPLVQTTGPLRWHWYVCMCADSIYIFSSLLCFYFDSNIEKVDTAELKEFTLCVHKIMWMRIKLCILESVSQKLDKKIGIRIFSLFHKSSLKNKKRLRKTIFLTIN